MAATATKAAPSSIEADVLYHLEEFKSRLGWSHHAMRTARRSGLKVRYVGGRAYVMGRDFFDYLDRLESEAAAQ